MIAKKRKTLCSSAYKEWKFTVDTRLLDSTETNTITGIPFTLYEQPHVKLYVDWGDNTQSTLTSDDWEDWKTECNLHEYSTPGEYTITIGSSDWNVCYIDTSSYNTNGSLFTPNTTTTARYTKNLYYYVNTLITVIDPIPDYLLGTYIFNNSSSTYTSTSYKVKSRYNFNHIFANCKYLTLIPFDIFYYNKYVCDDNSAAGYFYNCTSLPYIPDHLLDFVKKFNFNQLSNTGSAFFGNCISLTSIPAHLFDKFTTTSQNFLSHIFKGCTSITSIPEHLFDNCINATRYEYTFESCNSLTTIPEHLFDSCTKVYDFGSCFYSTGITTIPEDLFKYNTKVTTFSRCFGNDYNFNGQLISIPENLFKYNTLVTSFNDCFSYQKQLTSIPENLFKYNINATNFSSCFAHCTSLTSIPTDLFKYNTKVTNFTGCFNDTNITTIPANVFVNNTDVVNFSSCFASNNLTSIPEHLFDSNTKVTNFSNCFYCNFLLENIPEDLFKYNILATNFNRCFYSCGSNSSAINNSNFVIPENLFKSNTLATDFSYCFSGCNTLLSIPTNLFKYNTSVTTFNSCFYNCSSLTDFTLHIGSPLVTNATDFVTKKSNTTRIIYVPSGSTTETTFNNVASALGLTIISE